MKTAHVSHRWQPSWVQWQPYLCSSSLASLSILTPFRNTCSGALMFPTSGNCKLLAVQISNIFLSVFGTLVYVSVLRSEWLSWKWAWIHEVSPFRYGFEGVILSIYGMNRSELECPDHVCKFQKPEEVLQLLDVADAKLYVDFMVLGVFFLVLRLATYLVLRYKVKSER